MSMGALTPGSVFAGEFKVIRPLEAGGMGAIYEVEQLSTGALRALKLMLPSIVSSPKQRERFNREARASGRIESDHVVQVVAAGVEQATNTPWLAMELLKGEHLGRYVQRLGPQSVEKADAIFGQMCHAIAAAHRVGVVHRDLKPENVFISPSRIEGTPFFIKVLDFGIARITELAKTKRTDAAGTPLWMAPEQTLTGETIGPQTDVWALGLIAFWLLTGRFYWLSANDPDVNAFAVVREMVSGDIASASQRARELGCPTTLPPGFDAWFARCVDRQMVNRFDDAAELRAQLPAALGLPGPTGRISQLAAEPAAAAGSFPGASATPAPALGTAAGTADYLAAAGFDSIANNADLPQNHSAAGLPQVAATHLQAPQPLMAQPQTAQAPMAQAAAYPHHAPTQARVPATAAGPMAASAGGMPQPQLATSSAEPLPSAARSKTPIWLGIAAAAALTVGGGAALLVVSPTPAAHCADDKVAAEEREAACKEACAKNSITSCVQLGDQLLPKLASDPTGADAVIEAYDKACEGGDAPSCRRLGSLYQRGAQRGLKADSQRALKYLDKACDAEDALGCTLLGVEHDYKLGSDRDVTRVMSLYEKGCTAGDALGCGYAAMLHFSGRGIAKNESRSNELAKQALAGLTNGCSNGNAAMCSAQGTLLEWGLGTASDTTKAAGVYQRGCDDGDGVACNNLGALLGRGGGVMKSEERAWKNVSAACKAGQPAGCNNVASMEAPYAVVPKMGVKGATIFKHYCERELQTGCTVMGNAVNISPARADNLEAAAAGYQKGCAGGEPHACVNLGGMALYGRGVPYDKAVASKHFKQACDSGNPSGCGELGSLYSRSLDELRDVDGGNALMAKACSWGERDACIAREWHRVEGVGAKDLPTALAYFTKACDEKTALACYALGAMKQNALGTKKNVKEAFHLYQQACADGYKSACRDVGYMQLKGIGTKRDKAKGIAAIERLCKDGNYDSCVSLSQQLVEGSVIKKDTERANDLLNTSCIHQHAAACHELGYNYFMGNRGVKQDTQKGVELLIRACELDSANSCYNVGMVYGDAIKVKRDIAIAKRYLKAGCEGAIEPACKKLKLYK